jgi:hypothetical protein
MVSRSRQEESMGRVVGILFLVIAIWLGLQAFLGDEPSRDPEQAAASLLQRTEDTLRRDFESGHERREALLPE